MRTLSGIAFSSRSNRGARSSPTSTAGWGAWLSPPWRFVRPRAAAPSLAPGGPPSSSGATLECRGAHPAINPTTEIEPESGPGRVAASGGSRPGFRDDHDRMVMG